MGMGYSLMRQWFLSSYETPLSNGSIQWEVGIFHIRIWSGLRWAMRTIPILDLPCLHSLFLLKNTLSWMMTLSFEVSVAFKFSFTVPLAKYSLINLVRVCYFCFQWIPCATNHNKGYFSGTHTKKIQDFFHCFLKPCCSLNLMAIALANLRDGKSVCFMGSLPQKWFILFSLEVLQYLSKIFFQPHLSWLRSRNCKILKTCIALNFCIVKIPRYI